MNFQEEIADLSKTVKALKLEDWLLTFKPEKNEGFMLSSNPNVMKILNMVYVVIIQI